MSPSSRVHPPACLIWTFCRVSFACGPRPCLYFQCLFVICPTCIQTNGSFEVSLCLHYVSLRVLVLASHSVHACPNTCWRDRLMLRDQLHVMQGDKGLVCFYDRNDLGGCGDEREYIVCSYAKQTYCTHPSSLSIDLQTPRWNLERMSGCMCDT